MAFAGIVGWMAASAAAAGPHAVGWQDAVIEGGAGVGRVPARVYYPAVAAGEDTDADPASGPYPLAGFLHGWLGAAWMYDDVCTELASWGYVVASIDTQTGLILDMDSYADQALAMLDGVEGRSMLPGDALEGLVDPYQDRIALGHSMGGGTLAHLLALDPRIRTAVGFMPYEGLASYYGELAGFDGSLLLLSGSHDTTAPPRLQGEWLDAAVATDRSLLIEVEDMGHLAVTDLSFGEDPMPDDVQRGLVIAFGAAFVRAEHGGDEAQWATLIGPGLDGLGVPVLASRSHLPALWATLDADGATVSLGVAGDDGDEGEVWFGTGPAADGGGLMDATRAATVAMPDGVARTTAVDVPSGWQGDLWVAVQVNGPAGTGWTRAAPLSTGGATEPPEDEPNATTPADDPDPTGADPGADPAEPDDASAETGPRDTCGCATGAGPSSLWALAAAAAAATLARRGGWRRRGTRRGGSSTSPNAS